MATRSFTPVSREILLRAFVIFASREGIVGEEKLWNRSTSLFCF